MRGGSRSQDDDALRMPTARPRPRELPSSIKLSRRSSHSCVSSPRRKRFSRDKRNKHSDAAAGSSGSTASAGSSRYLADPAAASGLAASLRNDTQRLDTALLAKSDGGPQVFVPRLGVDACRQTNLPFASGGEDGVKMLRKRDARQGRRMAAAQESTLRKPMLDLEQFSIETKKLLDDAYYSMFDKLNHLRTTVSGLRKLAEEARHARDTFVRESSELVDEVSGQLDALGQFDDQAARISVLQRRVRDGRRRVEVLSNRVDAVRTRVENWEKADRAWQERTRRRLKAFWMITSAMVSVLVALLVTGQYYGPGATSSSGVAPYAQFPKEGSGLVTGHESGKASEPGVGSAINWQRSKSGKKTAGMKTGDVSEEDNFLKVFDEL